MGWPPISCVKPGDLFPCLDKPWSFLARIYSINMPCVLMNPVHPVYTHAFALQIDKGQTIEQPDGHTKHKDHQTCRLRVLHYVTLETKADPFKSHNIHPNMCRFINAHTHTLTF